MQTPLKSSHASAASAAGTTMRIEIAPEALHEAKRGKVRSGNGQPGGANFGLKSPVAAADAPLGGVHFQQLLHNIYDAVLITELSGEVLVANIRANQFFGAEPGQLHQFNILGLICGSDDSLLPVILEALDGNRFVLMQAHCMRMDGTTFPAEISANQLVISNQTYLSFFVRDVTLRKQQEERLRTGYTAIQNASSGIAIAGLDAEIEYCNPSFLSYFGLVEEHIKEHHNLRELLAEPSVMDQIIAAIWQRQTWSGELKLKTSTGSIFYGYTSVTPNVDADNELAGMVLSVLDVTSQKHAQWQLQEYAAELRKKNVQMEEDLNMASELHQAFLPRDFEGFPRSASAEAKLVDVKHLYHPSGTIGGDFFDIRELSSHELAIFISDVMGHGIRSALVVATIRGLIEQLRPQASDPGAFMTQLNATYTAIFKQMGGSVVFATALYMVLDTTTGKLRYANAGHPHPYILRPGEESVTPLRDKGQRPSPALGFFPHVDYPTLSTALAPRDSLVLYTDGLSEVESPARELFETNQFQLSLKKGIQADPKALLDQLLEDARTFATTPGFEDDICMVALQVLRLSQRERTGWNHLLD